MIKSSLDYTVKYSTYFDFYDSSSSVSLSSCFVTEGLSSCSSLISPLVRNAAPIIKRETPITSPNWDFNE